MVSVTEFTHRTPRTFALVARKKRWTLEVDKWTVLLSSTGSKLTLDNLASENTAHVCICADMPTMSRHDSIPATASSEDDSFSINTKARDTLSVPAQGQNLCQ